MALSPRIQPATEKYYCADCERYFSFLEVQQKWRCPICDHIVNIKVSINNYFHNCQRISPKELKIEEMVTMENEHIHQILNISKDQNDYRIALKEFRTITLRNTDYITRIDGRWCLD
jgi:DNA-directed RNA polymerase subunit RPC12/RpoP